MRWRNSMLRRAGSCLAVCGLCVAATGCISSMIDSFTGNDVASEVRAVGVPAQARVLEIWETGVRVNDNPVVGFRLEVQPDGMPPYEAETKALISILDIPQIQPGAVLTVLYDPDDPQRVTFPGKE